MEGRPTASLDSLAGDVGSHTLFRAHCTGRRGWFLRSPRSCAQSQSQLLRCFFCLTCLVPSIDSPLAGGQPKGHQNRTVEERRVEAGEAGWGPDNAGAAEGPDKLARHAPRERRENGGETWEAKSKTQMQDN